jgi:hypothetical protein
MVRDTAGKKPTTAKQFVLQRIIQILIDNSKNLNSLTVIYDRRATDCVMEIGDCGTITLQDQKMDCRKFEEIRPIGNQI